ncbi:hypothetical protein KDA14_00180 [Candidatus Saccharibacteria bacterium]|nr:hypothetical protein [Candidatus Saccharibacteria bacterium]
MPREVVIPPLPETSGRKTFNDRVVGALAKSVMRSVARTNQGEYTAMYAHPWRAALKFVIAAQEIPQSQIDAAIAGHCASQDKAVQIYTPSQRMLRSMNPGISTNLPRRVSVGTAFSEGDRIPQSKEYSLPSPDWYVTNLFQVQNQTQGATLVAAPKGQE